jgi:diguanylate cyclase (GGDEF)-like protein
MKAFTTMAAGAAGLAAATASAAVYGNLRLRRQLRDTRTALAVSRHAATHDTLTGLTNRAGLEAHLAMCQQERLPVWLLMVDLDGFKPINDTYGHAAGDVVLMEVARRLARVTDPRRDLVGRLGGDEFLIVSETGIAPVVSVLARSVVTVLRRPIVVHSAARPQVTGSVGWVHMRPGDPVGDVLHTADAAAYRAKAAGGDRQVAWGAAEPLRRVELGRPLDRLRDAHPHRVPAESGVVIAR